MTTAIVSSSIKLFTHASQLAVIILIIQERLLKQCDRPVLCEPRGGGPLDMTVKTLMTSSSSGTKCTEV